MASLSAREQAYQTEAVYHAVVLEEVAFMNFHAKLLNPAAGPMPQVLLDKHYLRKHGANAYYGQG